MSLDLTTRLVVIGNSGSGKSTFADRVGAALKLSVHDLDRFHWLSNGRKRDEAEAKELVSEVAAGEAWVIEGVYGWLAEVALSRATRLVWLDLTWADCRDALLSRGLRRGMSADDQKALIVWASAYWTRATPSSFAGHEKLFQTFSGKRFRLKTRAEIEGYSG
jgi:adenylate kinase family enzyme